MGVERVQFSREGGFTGIPLTAQFEISSLSPEEAATLQELAEAAHFFGLPSVIPSGGQGADQFHYGVTVEADGRRHTVSTGDVVPESLQDLIEFLTGLAKKARAKRRVEG